MSVLAAQIARYRYNSERSWRNAAAHASMVFTMPPPPIVGAGSVEAPPPTILAAGTVETSQPHSVSRLVVIPVEIGTPRKVDPEPRPVPVVPWLDRISFFIPKSIREPFLGDLREDLTNKAAKGHSRASVWCAAICQVVVLVLQLAWSSAVRR